MLFGYARVSTKAQNLDRQIEALTKAGVEERFIYSDKMSGAKENRPELAKVLDMLQNGDTLVVASLDRLARSVKQLVNISDNLDKLGVNLVSLKENIDTTTAQGRFYFQIIAAVAELERSLIDERVKEGVEVAKAKGKKIGRPSADKEKLQEAYDLYSTGKFSVSQVCDMTGTKRTSFYKYKAELSN